MSDRVRRLFVGGPWHGRVEPVPRGFRGDYWMVPVPLSPDDTSWLDEPMGVAQMCRTTQYRRQRYVFAGIMLDVMIDVDGLAVTPRDVFAAICRTAGLDLVGGP